MRRRAAAILAAVALLLLLSGCWDRLEIEDASYITSIGVDAVDDSTDLLWTFRIARAEQLAVGALPAPAGGQGLASSLVSVRAPTLVAAVQAAQASFGRVLVLQQMRMVGFGEALARRGIMPLVSQFIRHNEIRLQIAVLVNKGRSIDAMKAQQPTIDVNPAKMLEGLVLVQKRLHLAPPTRFQHLYGQLLSQGEDPFLAVAAVNPLAHASPDDLPPLGDVSRVAGELPRSGANPIEFAGTAVFHQDRLMGFLDINETQGLLALRGQMGKVYATVPNPWEEGQSISIRYGQENKPQVRTSFINGKPKVWVKLQLEGEILSASGRTGFTDPKMRRELEQYAAKFGRELIFKPLIQKVYQEWGADPAGFGDRFRMYFPTFNAWMAYDWKSHIKDLDVTVETDLYIRRFGMLLDVEK